MSGEPGASIQGEYYELFVGSGIIVNVAIPPGDDGSAIPSYFERESAPYRAWLARARPALDQLFAQLVAEGEPIVPRDQPYEELWGTFVEDLDDQGFSAVHHGGPLVVRLSGPGLLGDLRSLAVTFLVSRRVHRAHMERIVERVAEILMATDTPPAPEPVLPPPPRPPARRSLWSRLWGKRSSG
ncbi:MAG: hypothetical protein AB7P03_17360 [Kofleriaceae bacterium]